MPIRSPSNCRCSLWFPYECGGGRVFSRGRFVNLMMGIIMPGTCWAVSVRQSNKKILRLIVASSWVLYLSDWRCTEAQTLKNVEDSLFEIHNWENVCVSCVILTYIQGTSMCYLLFSSSYIALQPIKGSGLLNHFLPAISILDYFLPIAYIHVLYIFQSVIFTACFRSSNWSFIHGFPSLNP